MSYLLERYASGDSDIVGCYSGPIETLFERKPQSGAWDAQLVKSIKEFNAGMEHHPEFEGNEPVVITGQQPAVFGGPLYSIYKAITTIKLAETLTSKFGKRVVPVYWVGSEDHDFDEAASVYFPTRRHTTERLTLPTQQDFAGKALHQIPISDDYTTLVDTLVEHSSGGEFREEIEAFLHDTLHASDSLSDWSTRILSRFFRDTPLVFFAPHLAEARRCSADVIRRAIENPLAVTQAVNEGAAKMESLGFAAQVEKNDRECAFFFEADGVRAKVTWTDGIFALPELNKTLTEAELLRELDEAPEQFSPNVALRCVVQQHLFPTAAYIAGPGELAYWGQFKGVFDAFESPMPVVFPRAQAVLCTTKLDKLCRKYDLAYQDLFAPEREVLTRALESVSTSPAVAEVTKAKSDIANRIGELADSLSQSEPVASDMARALSADISDKLDRLESTVLFADKSRTDAVEQQVRRIQAMLAPNRKPQERMHCVAPYLFEHGWALCDKLMYELGIDTRTVQEVEL